jgi:hypothetical protein
MTEAKVMRGGAIGRFEILARINRGGMGDVYRCRVRGIGGFEKTVALKRIRAERASDPDFVKMFLDEARLAAILSHPNIVQVFEVGESGGDPYIAMEYVDGSTLAQLLRAARRSASLRLGPVVKILGDVAAGLHHAHSAVGANGEPLGLVHRDVSPQNILVSREGVPKLLDFGVAKANGRLSETRSGTLKGKLRYMAPEQLQGSIDHRADVFALGVCLFEATTGQSPYGPDHLDEITLFHNIVSGPALRPSRLVPDYPRLLEEIVMWALEPRLDKRCPSAWELHESLEEVVARPGPLAAGSGDVRRWVRELCPGDGERDQTAGGQTVDGGGEALSVITPLEQLTVLPPRPGVQPIARPAPGRGRAAALAIAAVTVPIALAALGLTRRSPAPAATVALAAPVRPVVSPPPAPPEPPAERAAAVGPPAPARAPERPRLLREPGKRRAAVPSPAPRLRAGDAPGGAPAGLAPRVETTPTAAAAHQSIFSARPSARVPLPGLPRVYRASGAEDLRRVLAFVEDETIRAGCSPPFARGITRPLQDALAGQAAPELFPAAIYYFIVRAAALGRDKQAAAAELGRVHSSGIVRALNRLPVDRQSRL